MSNELPREEVAGTLAQENAGRRGISREGVVLGLLGLVHVVFILVFFNPDPPRSYLYEHFLMMMLGVLLSQPILFSFWAAFAPQRFYHRFLWCLLLCTIVFFTEEVGQLRYSNKTTGMLMICDFSLFIVATMLLLVIRWTFGWQIQRARMINIPSNYRSYQFGIKHLILLMTITALIAGLFRSLLLLCPSEIKNLPSIVGWAGELGIYSAVLLPVIFLPWFTLACRSRTLLLIIIWIGLFGAIDFLIYSNYPIWRKFNPAPPQFLMVLLVQLGAGLSVLITTLPLRFCGYRMIRVRKGA